MRRAAWLVLLSFAVSCSSRDQSLGETRPSPRPIIEVDPDPNPDPDPDPNPDPDPDPNPDPNPDPDPDPTPSIPPCEDSSKHLRTGFCVASAECDVPPITTAGYECEGDAVCCHEGVGCGQDGCATGGTTSQGGAGGGGTDTAAGAGGNP